MEYILHTKLKLIDFLVYRYFMYCTVTSIELLPVRSSSGPVILYFFYRVQHLFYQLSIPIASHLFFYFIEEKNKSQEIDSGIDRWPEEQ